jgi:hydrogenase maturation protease
VTVRVFGLGHPDRGDDAVGLLIADHLEPRVPPGVVVRRVHGSLLELLDAWHPTDAVVVVDAVRAPAPTGDVIRFDAAAGPLPRGAMGGGTHDASLVDAIELARVLGRMPAHLVVYGVVGERFGVGDPMSVPVRDAAGTLTARIAGDVAGRTGR